ncbi:hypothetical protein HYU13_06635, partial [Candidatus Woesearchaeota archaeon]|nr:hypothetical protein [Candidatus Woesearchaeota archaeon]
PGKTINYSLPKDLLPNRFYLEGIWKSNPDDLELIGEKGKIALPFTAKAANIVAQHKDGNSSVFIFIDGKPMEKGNFGDDVAFGGDAPLPEGRQELSMELINKTTINVTMVNVTMINLPIMGISEPRLYNPYKGQYGSHTLVLEIAGKGFTFSAWTFG